MAQYSLSAHSLISQALSCRKEQNKPYSAPLQDTHNLLVQKLQNEVHISFVYSVDITEMFLQIQ